MTVRAIHQMMPGFAYADAIGNQAFRMRELLRKWGFKSQVYAQYRDKRLADPGLDYADYRPDSDAVLVYHHSIGSPVAEFVRNLPGRVIMYYHNITPANFLRGLNPELADLLEQGRCELEWFRGAPLALAASEYNRQELLALGIQQVHVLPYFVYLDELLTSASSSVGREIAARYADGWANLLFVGRVSPHKCQADLVHAYNYYHKLVNPRSRLILVGSDATAPGYRVEVEALCYTLGLEHVHFVGPVALTEGLGGYYKAASAFVCLSEHEGFCVPIVEAMAFDVPVLAYKATGVPYAMDGSGILVSQKRYDVIGELIDLVVRDPNLRQGIVMRQRERLNELMPNQVASQLKTVIEHLVS